MTCGLMNIAQSIGITQENAVHVIFAPLYRHDCKHLHSNRVFVCMSRSEIGRTAESESAQLCWIWLLTISACTYNAKPQVPLLSKHNMYLHSRKNKSK